VSVELGGLIKKIAMYLLAVAIPLGLILVYEGFVWSKNREFLQEQERRCSEQQAREQHAQVQRDREQVQENIDRVRAARQAAAENELRQLQQMLGEQRENELLRCVMHGDGDQCECFDQHNAVIDVGDVRCRNLATGQ